eukprot:sb/3478044/
MWKYQDNNTLQKYVMRGYHRTMRIGLAIGTRPGMGRLKTTKYIISTFQNGLVTLAIRKGILAVNNKNLPRYRDIIEKCLKFGKVVIESVKKSNRQLDTSEVFV